MDILEAMFIEPQVGDWFCLPQNVVRVDKHAPAEKEHRWIIASSRVYEVAYPSLLRTTKSGYGGALHPPHNGSCGADDCRIDLPGWIIHDRVFNIPRHALTPARLSCREPDDKVKERVMNIKDAFYRNRKRRASRRSRKRK